MLERQSTKSEDYVKVIWPASIYAADFRLLATDIPWDDQALMEQFCYGLHNDVKDLLLTFLEEPVTNISNQSSGMMR